MDDSTRKCGVCRREKPKEEIAGVASSIISAMSLTYCRECLEKNAVEHEVSALASHPSELRDNFANNHTVFHNGEYISVREFLLK